MSAVELPHWDARPGDLQRCLETVDEWANTLLDSRVIETFSPSMAIALAQLNGSKLFDALDAFAAEHWDSRHGRERNLATVQEFSPEQCSAIENASGVLGLDGTPPPQRKTYDAVILTGGMVRAGIVKPRYLRELYDTGLRWGEAVFLGGFRPFAGDELELAGVLGVEGDNEFDSMTAGMRFAFGLGEPDTVKASVPKAEEGIGNAQWREESWLWNDQVLRVVAAPSSEPQQRRANTIDTYRFWASRTENIASILVITTSAYVPYQAAGAVEVFGMEFGCSVETVAVSAAANDLGEHTQKFLPMHLAQEMRSAVHGMRKLRKALIERS